MFFIDEAICPEVTNSVGEALYLCGLTLDGSRGEIAENILQEIVRADVSVTWD